MGNVDNSDEDKFYQEMDKEKIHQSCCTCQSLVILFVGLLIFLLGGIFYLYWQITHEKALSFKTPVFANNLMDKVKGLSPDSSGSVQLVLTDQEMSAILSGGLNMQRFILKDIQTQITPNDMFVFGSVTSPLKSKITMTILPNVREEKINFEVKNMTAGKLNFPGFVNDQVAKNLTGSLNQKLEPVYSKLKVEEISLEEGKIIIKGKQKF